MAIKHGSSDLARFFGDLVRCETRLYNALGDELRSAHGIAASQFELLRHVRDHREARVADLAAEFAVGVGAASKGVDRLEQRGWLRRVPNPRDRRSVHLELTAEGAALVEAAERTFRRLLDQVLTAAVPDDGLATTAATLAALRTHLEQRNLGLPAG